MRSLQKFSLLLSCFVMFGCDEGNPDIPDIDCETESCDTANDKDGDGVADEKDNCPDLPNKDQADADGDTIGDACQNQNAPQIQDKDGDGVADDQDNCPDLPNKDQADTDGDTIGDACQIQTEPQIQDKDGDGVADDQDNCPDIANKDQADTDGDTIGDACQIQTEPQIQDKDGDGIADDQDNCPDIANKDQKDTDHDGLGDACDSTPNGTGTPDAPFIIPVDACITNYTDTGDTSKSPSSIITKYPLFEDKLESGPEYYYKLEVKNRSRLNVYIKPELDTDKVDVDVHLLSSIDANTMSEYPGTLMTRNDKGFMRLVDPGTYYIVADSFENLPGPYELHVEIQESCGESSHCDGKCFNEKKVDFGMWYSVWYAYTKSYSSEVFENTWTATKWGPSINYRPLLSTGNYDMYDSIDHTETNFFISQMSDAGVDFIIMDETNRIKAEHGYIEARAIETAKVMKSFIDSNPNRRPVKYLSAIGAIQFDNNGKSVEDEAAILWDRYTNTISDGINEKYHYYLDGKPLLIIYGGSNSRSIWESYNGSKTYASKFTIRWAGNDSLPGYYGWAYDKGTQIHSEVEVVMPGWNNNAGHKPVNRDGGLFYRNSTNTVLSNPIPKIVVINSFNEYAERTAVWSAKTDTVIDDDGGNKDKWYNADANPVLKPTMYWDMTRNFIQEVRARE